ncbi:MAG TPA: DUF167 domain-containing protein [Sphingomonas sp.]|nr:DUF167 domain-containing protein [Sphingomonas sp.]
MARAPRAAPNPDAILALADAEGRLAIRATPNARADAVMLPPDGAPAVLAIRTTATPENGRANEAILTLLAAALGRPRTALTLLRGATARDKLVRIEGL